MKKITIHNSDSLPILTFNNFEFRYQEYFKEIAFCLDIEFDFFKANTILYAEEHDFLNMKECLEKIYKKEWDSFVFNPIDEQLNIEFILLKNDKLKVKVKLCNKLFTGRMEFEVLIDMEYIPRLLREITEIFENSP